MQIAMSTVVPLHSPRAMPDSFLLSPVRVGAEVTPTLLMQPLRLREVNRFPSTHSWEAREHFIPDCALTWHGGPRLPDRVTAGTGAGPRASPVVGSQPRLRVTAQRSPTLGTNPSFLSSLFFPWPSPQRACLSVLSFHACPVSMFPGHPGCVFIPFCNFSPASLPSFGPWEP